ncbi:MAG: hypothetical protein ISN29_11415 [Gammaproteobacteria bacterium AqS3]|nr:hypothetical protein [Gammaproteobacteria bacterium AqS3]
MSESGFSYWLQLTVIDDDDVAVGLTLSQTSTLTMDEGGTATFTVKLAAQPGKDRTVNLSSNNSDVTIDVDPDITGNQTALTFTAANWNTPQTVTVSAAQDADTTNDEAIINLTGAGVVDGAVDVTVTDDDIGLTLSKTELTMNEGGTATFTVKLDKKPGSSQTITLSSNNTDVTVSPTTLTFTGGDTGNWGTVQTVTLTAAHDADTTDDSATINLTGAGITAGSVGVTVTDDDNTEGGFSLSQTSITTGESWGHVIKAGLTKQPTANVIVTVITNNPDVNIYRGNELTFTPSNWSVRQAIALNTLRDADIIDDIATISLTAAGGGYDSVTGAVVIKIIDDGILEFSVDSFIHLAEGTQSSFTMKLAAQPSENMTITFASSTSNSDVTFDTNANSAGNQNTLTFTTSNWSTPQTVKVSAADDTDHTDESGRLKVRLPSGAHKYIAVYVYDDDIELNLSATSLTLDEGGSGTFTVRPATESKWRRTVSLTSDNSDITFNKSKLTFHSTNWRTAKTVTVRAAEDDDAVDDTATIGFEMSIHENNNLVVTATDTVTVTVRDDDAGAAGFNISAIAPEAGNGSAGLYSVRLDSGSAAGKLIDLEPGGDDVMSGLWSGDGAVLGLGELGSGVGSGHRVFVAGLGFSNGEMSVSTGNANLHFAQLEHRKNRSNHDGSGQQFGRRRPENRPHHIPRDRHVNLGFEHRRRHPTSSA